MCLLLDHLTVLTLLIWPCKFYFAAIPIIAIVLLFCTGHAHLWNWCWKRKIKILCLSHHPHCFGIGLFVIKTMLQRFLGCYPTPPRDACFPLRTCSNSDDNASVVLSMGRPRTVCLRVARNSRGTRRNSRAGLGLSRGLSDSRGSSSVVSLSGLVVSRTRPPLISCSLVFSAQQVSPR